MSLLAAALLLGACGESADPEPIGDYTAWKRIDATGPAPGHGDTYRIIYVNEVAADPTWDLYLGYREGSVVVKEVRDDVEGEPGDLRYLAVMRRIGTITTAQEDQGGWLYTQTSSASGDETQFDFCWNRCHAAAPYNGAWYDYRN
ncbi:MAG: cytochrome P460 family protein [Kofleriaceae bacterium]